MSTVQHVPLRFEPLRYNHIDMLLPMEHEAYPDPWSQGMFCQEITNQCSHFFMVFKGKTLVGYGGFWIMVDEIHITKLTVAKLFRRQGIGLRIVNFLLRLGKSLGATQARLEVREHNDGARKLYESIDFRVVGVRKGYYTRTNENALVMMKDL